MFNTIEEIELARYEIEMVKKYQYRTKEIERMELNVRPIHKTLDQILKGNENESGN